MQNKYLRFDTERILKKICSENPDYSYFKNKHSFNIKRVRGTVCSFTFPKLVKIKPEAVGLIVGEGFIDNRRFVFANSNDQIIEEVLEFMSQFNIKPKTCVEFAVKNALISFVDDGKKFWELLLDYKVDHVRLRKEFFNTTKYGTLHLCYHNVFLSKALRIIVNSSKTMASQSKNIAIGYVRGLIAAEGNINIKKQTKCVYQIRISAKEKSEREHYKKCLNVIGIKIYCKDMPTIDKDDPVTANWKTKKGRAGAIILSRWDNFLKIFMLDLLSLHRAKEDRFCAFFRNNLFTQCFFEMAEFRNKVFTLDNIRKKLNLRKKPTRRINTMINRHFVKRISRVLPYRHRLTEDYEKVYRKFVDYSVIPNQFIDLCK